eukprot:TRINITY_DN2770_c0_g1_i5.p1 TRINITY_DN2770_c0_g1~~TRINITY_DN2770_c0_g1_i5.p1  ORF type:complete len:322 (-),score=28.45 TRINITY_DN2770_c0_g1_i5:501-1466(-)
MYNMEDHSASLSQVQISIPAPGSSSKPKCRKRSFTKISSSELDLIQRPHSARCKSTTLDPMRSYSLVAPCNGVRTPPSRRLYEIWPGRNRFWCFGRCVSGPTADCKYVLITWGIILGFSLLYFVMIVPTLTSSLLLYIPVFSGVLFVLTVVFFLLTSLSDPGIIPRKELFELFGPVPVQYTARVVEQYFSCERPTLEQLNEFHKVSKLCPTCRIQRPPRASHCPSCDNCIEVFDHHCPFVGNCVGKRNYRFFVIFLICLVLYGLSMIIGFVFTILARDESYKVIRNTKVLIIVIVILGAALVIPLALAIALLIYHLYLLCK